MQSYILILLGVVVAGIIGVAYYAYTSSQALNTRMDSCDEEVKLLKVKLQGVESIFAKPPVEDLAPIFDLSHQPKPFDMTPQWTKIDPQTGSLFCNDEGEASGLKQNETKDPWVSSSENSRANSCKDS